MAGDSVEWRKESKKNNTELDSSQQKGIIKKKYSQKMPGVANLNTEWVVFNLK